MTAVTATASPPRARGMLLATEVSLAALTCSAAFGLVRLFADASFVPQVVTAAVLAHVLAAGCRRRGLSVGVTVLLGGVGLALVLPWLVLGETTTLGLPTGETLEVARAHLSEAWAQFGEVKAPAPTLTGFVLASTAGAWGLALLADTAAFRANGLVEAMVPSSTLFVFGAALGAPRQRVVCTALFLSSLLAFWLCARAYRQLASPSWMTKTESRGTRSILRTGVLIGGTCVLAAVVLGPNLPGASAEPVIPWRASDRASGGSRVTVSPLVDIRTRIVDQAATEVFKVRSSERSYWRLTALETFDGRIWSSSRKYRKAEGRLGTTVSEEDRVTQVVEQRFTVIALDSIWLPAAFRPVAIDGSPARYDGESGSLLAEAETAIGARYVVQSAIPRLDADLLTAARREIPPEVAETYLDLPDGFPNNVTALAVGVVGDATAPYAQAKRLQDFFRNGNFTYDLDVAAGHGDAALESFLFDTRRGYCEQFAGAYAAMARAAGLPARVAVGFTAGELGPDGAFSVRGYHGHAWPEVYFDGVGWVAFEPTPGRGIPGGEAYTGLPEEQAAPGSPNTPTTLATTTTVAPAGSTGSTTIPDLGDLGSGETGFDTDPAPNPWPRRLTIAAAVLLGIPLLWVTGLFFGRASVRWRRRARATGAQRLGVAWDEVGAVLARFGVPRRPSETPKEYAARASASARLDPELLAGLAGLTTVARYAPPDVAALDDETIERAVEVARDVQHQVRGKIDRRARVRYVVDPRVGV